MDNTHSSDEVGQDNQFVGGHPQLLQEPRLERQSPVSESVSSGDRHKVSQNPDLARNTIRSLLWQKVKQAGLHDWLMVLFTGVLTVVACQNSRNSSSQMGRVIDAANRIEDAADSFAGSASRLNAGVDSAVQKLNLQASGTNNIARQALKQATTAKEAFEAESRPYISLGNVAIVPVKGVRVLRFIPAIKNSGRIPAEDVDFHCEVFIGGRQLPAPVPPHRSRIMDPGDTATIGWDIFEPDATPVISGAEPLVIYCAVSYRWRNHNASYCSKRSFDPRGPGFIDQGSECSPSKTGNGL